MKAIFLLLMLLVLAAGCHSNLNVYESQAPRGMVVSITNGTVYFQLTRPSEVVLVTGTVQRLEVPLFDSPSIAGDRARCSLAVPVHSIPAHPEIQRVTLHYDSHGLLRGLRTGTQMVLRFRHNGHFAGVELPVDRTAVDSPADSNRPFSPPVQQYPEGGVPDR